MNQWMEDPWRFPAGARAVVSGGTKGLGASIVEELCKKGASVLTCSRHETSLAKKICAWKVLGYEVDGVVVDLSTSNGRYAFADAIRTWLGGEPLDVLVNNVGKQPSSLYDESDSDDIWASNFHSMFMLTSICQEQLRRETGSMKGSSVVNIASVVGFTDPDTNAPYPAAKAAVIKATGDWACEWGPYGIRVNCVAPWLIRPDDDSPRSFLKKPEDEDKRTKRVPLGRYGEATEVAGLVTFLCLPIAGYISGQVICVDGGFSRSENNNKVSKHEERQTGQEVDLKAESMPPESMPHLSLKRLEKVCLENDESFDVSFFETHKSLFGNRKSSRTNEDCEKTNEKWERFRLMKTTGKADRKWEGEDTLSQSSSSSSLSRFRRQKSRRKGDGTEDYSSGEEDNSSSSSSLVRRFRRRKLTRKVESREEDSSISEDEDTGADASYQTRSRNKDGPLPDRQASSSRSKSPGRLQKSVSFLAGGGFERMRSDPLPALTVIDEVVEADFDKSEPIDLDRVKSFRDRLRRIQEKKNARRSLLDRSRSLKCVFPTTSDMSTSDLSSLSCDTDSIAESRDGIPVRIEQTDYREI